MDWNGKENLLSVVSTAVFILITSLLIDGQTIFRLIFIVYSAAQAWRVLIRDGECSQRIVCIMVKCYLVCCFVISCTSVSFLDCYG